MKSSDEEIKFSIIIPARNAENTIKRCILSITEQNYGNTEIIVIINNSSDGTDETVRGLMKEHGNIIRIATDTPGVSNARNLGLDAASGDVIGFCDADDEYIDGIFEKVSEVFLGNLGTDICVTGYERIDGGNKAKKRRLFKDNRLMSAEEFIGRIFTDSRVLGSVCNKFYSSSFIGGNRFDASLELCEDTYFNAAAAYSADPRIIYIRSAGYRYYYSAGSATNNYKNIFTEKYTGYIDTVFKIKNEIAPLSEREKKYCDAACASLAMEAVNIICRNRIFEDGRKKYYLDNLRALVLRNYPLWLFSPYIGPIRKAGKSIYFFGNIIKEGLSEAKKR